MTARRTALLVACAYLLSVGLAALRGVVPGWSVLVYAVMGALTFGAYARDKRRAARGQWRTSELALHVLELFGGWPGALVAQWHLGHKTRKPGYQLAFWTIVALHLALLVLAWTAHRPRGAT